MFSIDTSRNRSKSTSRNKNTTLNTTRSTQRINGEGKVKLYDLPRIPSYYKIDRPTFTKERKHQIEEKLTLNKSVEIAAAKRAKQDNMFLRYKKNPFLSKSQSSFIGTYSKKKIKERTLPTPFYEKKREKSFDCLNEAVNNLRENNCLVINDNTGKKRKIQKQSFSQGIQNRVKFSNLGGKKKESGESPIEAKFGEEMDLEKIILLQDQNYYIKNQKPINIFSIINRKPQILNSKILDNYFFCYNSVIEKVSRFRIQTERDLSKHSRQLSLRKIFKKQEYANAEEEDVRLNFSKLQFDDLMRVASGRCTPDAIFNGVVRRFRINSEHDLTDGTVVYKQNTRQKANNFLFQNEQAQEVTKYLREAIKDKDQLYINRYSKVKDRILQGMEQRKSVSKKTIHDKGLHNQLTQKMKKEIVHFLKMDSKVKDRSSKKSPQVVQNQFSGCHAQTVKFRQLKDLFGKIKKQQEALAFFQGKSASTMKLN